MRPGQRVGPYVVRELLGRGAMGLVLRVEHPELGHEYALKVVRPEMLGDPESVGRFRREMEALARVDDHPGIVRVHSAGETADGAPFYAMELVRGRSLAEALKRGLLARDAALDVLAEVAAALAHLHARGIVHRDVKPENVLVDEAGRARLTDFGLARSLGLRADRLTRTGDLVGTPTHMAPEQALGAEVGPWTDVYALGVVLYEVLTGRTPHTGATALEVFRQVAEGAPFPPPSRLADDVAPALEAVCLRALARRAIDRYPDVASFAQDLARARAGPPPRPRPRRPPDGGGRRRCSPRRPQAAPGGAPRPRRGASLRRRAGPRGRAPSTSATSSAASSTRPTSAGRPCSPRSGARARAGPRGPLRR
ncbi:MAG: serine/threonine protein kinase [Planctomycetes bacterium]|nr:serine/threonine protein kinase [Planctomycetota bacterium]